MEFVYNKYYIIDNFENYYRLNEHSKLVVTHDKKDATVFSFDELEARLGKGRRSRFYKALPTDDAVLEGYLVEGNIVSSISEASVAPCNRNSEVSDGMLVPQFSDSCSVHAEQGDTEDVAIGTIDSLAKVNWSALLHNVATIIVKIPAYKDKLIRAQAEADQTICDIMHFIKLYEYDEQEAIEMMERLREVREWRRMIKNEMFRLECFRNSIGTTVNADRAMEAYNKIKGKETGIYRPRVAPQLFEGKQIKSQQIYQCLADMEEMIRGSRDKKQAPAYLEREGKAMESSYERIATIYDEEKMNWLAFVQLQAEFFRNAEQHIQNLKYDLNNIDAAIEEVLSVIEGANYNVTQGYRAFKELKDLRNERKETQEELWQVEMILSRFDCKSMLAAYEEIESALYPDVEAEAEPEDRKCDEKDNQVAS